MKKRLVAALLLPLFTCLSFVAPQPKSGFAGDWEWVQHSETSTFSLKLQQKGNQLTGGYCAIAQSGNRIDCGMEGEDCAVTGTVNKNTVTVKYTSCYSGKSGTATITYVPEKDRLLWQAKPNGPEAYFPVKAELKRQ